VSAQIYKMISKTSLRNIAIVQKLTSLFYVNPILLKIFAVKNCPITSCTFSYIPHSKRWRRETVIKVQIVIRLLFIVWLIQRMALNPVLQPVDIMLGVLILSPIILSVVYLHVTFLQIDSVEWIQILRRVFGLDKYLGK
jgi:hypothetical protein